MTTHRTADGHKIEIGDALCYRLAQSPTPGCWQIRYMRVIAFIGGDAVKVEPMKLGKIRHAALNVRQLYRSPELARGVPDTTRQEPDA